MEPTPEGTLPEGNTPDGKPLGKPPEGNAPEGNNQPLGNTPEGYDPIDVYAASVPNVVLDIEVVGMFGELDAFAEVDGVTKLEDKVSEAVAFEDQGTVALYVPFSGEPLGQNPL